MAKLKTNYTADATIRLGKNITVDIALPINVEGLSLEDIEKKVRDDFQSRAKDMKIKINNASELKTAIKTVAAARAA